MWKVIHKDDEADSRGFETLTVNKDGGALFVEMKTAPMNLFGPELIGELASLIKQAESDTSIKVTEYQERMQAAMKRGFQTRDAEMNLGQLIGSLQG